MKLLHGCDEVVARLSRACDKIAGTLQPCHNLVISIWVATGTDIKMVPNHN